MSFDEIDSDAYALSLGEGVRVGDICEAVALPDLAEPQLFRTDEQPYRPLIAGRMGYALVVAVYEEYVTVVPIMVAEGVEDRAAFDALVRTAENASRWMRVPPPAEHWEQDGIALFFMPHTLSAEGLVNRRVARMDPPAREIVAARFAHALSSDGD